MGFSNNIYKFLIEKAKIERRPITVNLELLPVCNLDCKMCYIHSSMQEVEKHGGLKKVEQWLEFAKELKNAGVLFLLLTGGEVFLYPEFKRLYIELYKMGFVLTINTNATLIDAQTVEWLKQYPPKCISISLYGASNEVYEALCGKKGMFTKVDHAIQLLLQNQIAIECKTMFTPLNMHDAENCWQYIKKTGVPYETASYSFPPARKLCEEKQIRFTPEEAVACTFACNKMMSTEEEYDNEILKHLEKYEKNKDVQGTDQKGLSCSACNTSCWITWQGNMTPCALLNFPYTRPFENGFLNSWEALKKEADDLILSVKCSHCEKRKVCTVCPAAAYAETGQINGTSEYHCKMTSLLLDQMYQYAEKKNLKINTESIVEE